MEEIVVIIEKALGQYLYLIPFNVNRLNNNWVVKSLFKNHDFFCRKNNVDVMCTDILMIYYFQALKYLQKATYLMFQVLEVLFGD